MFRFIDMRGQGTVDRFAFFDTISGSFVSGYAGQAWENADDVKSDKGLDDDTKRRMFNLLPEWVHRQTDPDTYLGALDYLSTKKQELVDLVSEIVQKQPTSEGNVLLTPEMVDKFKTILF